MEKSRKIPKYYDVDGFRLPTIFQKYHEAVQYEHRPNDLFLVTYPKCGTNWTRQILQLLFNKGEIVDKNPMTASDWVFLEMHGSQGIASMKQPGLLATHLSPDKLPFSEQARYISVTRNPKDCCVSYYHHIKSMGQCEFQDGTFDDFFDWFVRGECYFGDYFDHLLPWYARRNEPNVLFFTYEAMKADPKAFIVKIANFIGNDYGRMLEQDEQILENILERSTASFMKSQMEKVWKELQNTPLEEMPEEIRTFIKEVKSSKPNAAGPGFDVVRKGEVGDWKNYFSEEQSARMDERIAEKTRGSDVMNLFDGYM